MRKLIIAFLVVMFAWGVFWVGGSANAVLQTTGPKVCRLYRMMQMEGGVCQWYCWRCDTMQPVGEVNACSAGPGGCSGTFGCFFLPAQAPSGPAPEAPPEKGKGGKAPPVAVGFFGKSGQILDPINNIGKTGVKRLSKRPTVTKKSGDVVYEKVLRFKTEEGGDWRKALVCIVSYDPPGDKPTLTVGCGREFDAEVPNTPHDLEATEVETSVEFPYLVEATAGAVTYMIALHETSTE